MKETRVLVVPGHQPVSGKAGAQAQAHGLSVREMGRQRLGWGLPGSQKAPDPDPARAATASALCLGMAVAQITMEMLTWAPGSPRGQGRAGPYGGAAQVSACQSNANR